MLCWAVRCGERDLCEHFERAAQSASKPSLLRMWTRLYDTEVYVGIASSLYLETRATKKEHCPAPWTCIG